MRDAQSAAAWVVCPWCDERKCVGRYNCKQISDYIKTQEETQNAVPDEAVSEK